MKRELNTVFLIKPIRGAIWKVVGAIKCLQSIHVHLNSVVNGSGLRGKGSELWCGGWRTPCAGHGVLTCVINSLSHGYKLCYINQVKTTGYISSHWLSRTLSPCPVPLVRNVFIKYLYLFSIRHKVTRLHQSTNIGDFREREWRVTNYHFLNTLDWLAQWACVTSFCRAAQNGGGRRTHDCIRRHYFWPQKQVLIWMEVICYDSLPLPPAPARKREPGSREL